MVGVENFTVCDRRSALWSASNYGAILLFNPRFVMNLSTCIECLTFEALVDCVVGGSAFNDAISDSGRCGLRDGVVGMNKVDNVKFCGLELR